MAFKVSKVSSPDTETLKTMCSSLQNRINIVNYAASDVYYSFTQLIKLIVLLIPVSSVHEIRHYTSLEI